jgi:hypothetical protein
VLVALRLAVPFFGTDETQQKTSARPSRHVETGEFKFTITQMIPRRRTAWLAAATPANEGAMMRTNLRCVRGVQLVACVALCSALWASASQAFTQEDQRRLCTGDVFRLCSSEIPDVERITACMRKHRANLSEGCRNVFGKPAQSASAK